MDVEDFLPKAGELIKVKKGSLMKRTLYPIDLADLDAAKQDSYRHQLWVENDDTTTLKENTIITVIYYMKDPRFIYYYPSEPWFVTTTNLTGCIAYIFYKNSLWTTHVFKTQEEFIETYETVRTIH